MSLILHVIVFQNVLQLEIGRSQQTVISQAQPVIRLDSTQQLLLLLVLR